ncbi:LytTR family DNA-binding domain-containing protein [Pricia sp. S334]|uniref:LytTR family DNA-binding domain-containing protein n=1 Tax=Pricia mediterranea TaxID=3076079 RepID=A0ABU3L6X2_9FLAO|nr:LytTR family DNA-binding domain-containing protein [Pricia sp. S334]MDT7828968.1 LytTR family DNA-binding domain-containing protein [Pricia sp. S334]
MIKTLIIDDEQHCINVLVNYLKKYDAYHICAATKTLEEAVELTASMQPDLVFLDIDLGNGTGFDYLEAVRPNIAFSIIFTTAYDSYAVKAIKFSALDYLLKPIDHNELHTALQKVESTLSKRERFKQLESLEHNAKHETMGNKFIHIFTTGMCHKINTKDIVYLKSDNSYTEFYLEDKPKVTASNTLKYYAELLEESHFYRINKSYLVNTQRIENYRRQSRELILDDRTILTVAVRRQKEFLTDIFKK